MIVDFSSLNCTESPTLVLRNLDGTPLQTLGFAFNVEVELSYNEVSTLTFSLPAFVDGEKTPHYDEVVGMRIIDLRGCGQFILVDPQEDYDGPKRMKTCKGYSLEYEFTKKNIYLEAGTYNFFSGTVTAGDNTIIGRIKERLPDWNYNIDTSLIGKYRTFDDINKKVYDFIKSDVQQSYGCIFNFDTYTRTVYVRSVDSVVPTKRVYLSQEALIKKLTVEEDSDSIVTCLDVNGADGVDIRSVNPTGTNKIYNLDYFMNTTNFTPEIINKWRAWERACDEARENYYSITISYNMKLLEIVTEQAALTDLESEYTTLDNVRAVVIQGISQGLKTQSDLTEVNEELEAKQAEIDALSMVVDALKAEALELNESRERINERLSFNYKSNGQYVWFTPGEVAILQRYFLEDTIEDSSFVAKTVESYSEEDMSATIANQTVTINSSYTRAMQTGSMYYSFHGGTVSLSSLQGNIIRGTLSYNTGAGSIVFTAYLDGGKIGGADFESGNLTLMGKATVGGSASGSSLSFSLTDGRFYFTKNSTEYEKNQIEWELYEYGKQVLREHAGPTYNFTVDCANFLALEDYLIFQQQLKLGERVYLNLGNRTNSEAPLVYFDDVEVDPLDPMRLEDIEWYEVDEILEPYVVSIHINYENPSSFNIEFSSSYNSFDHTFSIAKLLDQSVSMGKTMNYKSGMYSSFVNSGASTFVKKFMESALDIAKNRVLSSGNQAITFDDTGIRVRMWEDDSHQSYEPEEIWIVNNMMVFTDDNWDTAKLAIGKIFDQNLITYKLTEDTARDPNKTYYLDDQGTVWNGSPAWSRALYETNNDGNVYGIAAPYIVGTLLAGENLVIQATKPDGEHMSFTVDSKGASLYNANLEVANDNSQIVLSPEVGIVVGLTGAVETTAQGETILHEDLTKFWVDEDGNAHFSGAIGVGGTVSDPVFSVNLDGDVYAKNGTFDGVIRAKAIYVNGQNIMTNTTQGTDAYGNTVDYVAGADGSTVAPGDNSKIASNWLSLYGIEILDPATDKIKMTIDGQTGDVMINGGTYYGGNYYATGVGRNSGASYYICNGFRNPTTGAITADYAPGLTPNRVGYLSYDNTGDSYNQDALQHRILLKSIGMWRASSSADPIYMPIKLESGGDISFEAGVNNDGVSGVIWIASPTVYTPVSYGGAVPSGDGKVGQIYYYIAEGGSGWVQAVPYIYLG